MIRLIESNGTLVGWLVHLVLENLKSIDLKSGEYFYEMIFLDDFRQWFCSFNKQHEEGGVGMRSTVVILDEFVGKLSNSNLNRNKMLMVFARN